MTKASTTFLLIAIIMFELLVIGVYVNKHIALKNQYSSMVTVTGQQIDELGKRLSEEERTVQQLESDNSLLNAELENVYKTNTELKESQEYLLGRAESTMKRIDAYYDEINDSMSWFKSNSVVKDTKMVTELGRCLELDEYTCTINTACFNLVNSIFYGFQYMPDQWVAGKDDKLFSLKEFISHKGGDCEDYSLLYKAQFNALAEDCEEKSIVLKSWEDGPGTLQLTETGTWYIDEAKEVRLEGYTHPLVACGRLVDNKGRLTGHCLVLFANDRFMESLNQSDLEGSPLIEPQDGKFRGRVGDGIGISDGKDRDRFEQYISMIISDEDLMLVRGEDFVGYSRFIEDLSTMRTNIVENIS